MTVDPLVATYGHQQLAPHYNFDQWATFARSQHQTMLVHVNYGTGTPQEAAAWVRYANLEKHYGVRYWEVGEEEYGDGAVGRRNQLRGPGLPQTSSVTNALSLAETVPALLASGAQTVDWWAMQSGIQGNDSTGVGDLELVSSGNNDCLPASNLCAPPVDTPYPDYYAMELVS